MGGFKTIEIWGIAAILCPVTAFSILDNNWASIGPLIDQSQTGKMPGFLETTEVWVGCIVPSLNQ